MTYAGHCLFCGRPIVSESPFRRYCSDAHRTRERRAVKRLALTTPGVAYDLRRHEWVALRST